MGCATIQVDGITAHVCGPGIGVVKRCRICGRPASALCDWPKVRTVNLQFDQVKVGDLVYAYKGSKQEHRLVYLQAKPEVGQVWLATAWDWPSTGQRRFARVRGP